MDRQAALVRAERGGRRGPIAAHPGQRTGPLRGRLALRAATRRVTEVHPALGQYQRDTVHTGAWCSYQPETPVHWQI